ncbi:MAG: hypothetical protein WD078_01965 [Woeseia sp.]
MDGIIGDRHRAFERRTFTHDKQPEGTTRRNERQWSAVSVEELAEIAAAMGLREPLKASDLGANLCLYGVRQLSRLPKGTTLEFPSGAILLIEEYNPPCLDLGTRLSGKYETLSGKPLSPTAFSKAAKLTRGVVGVVEVAGVILVGDEVIVRPYAPPRWLERSST